MKKLLCLLLLVFSLIGVYASEAFELVDVYEYIIGSDMDDSSARSFADNDTISTWADVYVKKASASGLINGDDKGCFNPKNDTTRAEASAVLSRMLEMTEED